MKRSFSVLFILGLLLMTARADNQVVERKYKHKPIANDHLGIVSLSVNGKIDLKFLGGVDPDERQSMLYGKLFQWLPQAFEDSSSCSTTEICTTAVLDSVSPHRFLLDHNDSMTLNLPRRVHFSGDKATWPKHYLVLEITEVHDDSSFRDVHPAWALGHPPMMGSTARTGMHSERVRANPGRVDGDGVVDIIVEDKKKPEECLHYECKYAFVDCSNNALVCYGTVSAEGCSASVNRDGPMGVWRVSMKELVKEIVDNSPFQPK